VGCAKAVACKEDHLQILQLVRSLQALVDFPSYPSWNPFIKSLEGDLKEGGVLKAFMQVPGGAGQAVAPRVVKGSLGLGYEAQIRSPRGREVGGRAPSHHKCTYMQDHSPAPLKTQRSLHDLHAPNHQRCAVKPSRELRWLGRMPLATFSGEHFFVIEPSARNPKGCKFIQGEVFGGWLVPVLGGMLGRVELGFVQMNEALRDMCEGKRRR
jgi:hypothetical protein